MRRLIIALIFLTAGAAHATTPTISLVSGTVSTGATLTITGSNMMDEDKSGWQSRFTSGSAYGFEGSTVTADGYYMGGGNVIDPVYDSSVKLSGNKSLKARGQGAWEGPNGPASLIYFPGGGGAETGDIWIRKYVRMDILGGTWPSEYQKIIDSQGSAGQYYLDTIGNSTFMATWQIGGSNTAHYVDAPGGGLQSGRWYAVELHWKASPSRIYELYIDNTLMLTGSTMTTADLTWLLVGLINYGGTSSAFSENVYYDNLAVSSSRIRPSSIIEVSGDGITWKYQEPVALGDTSSQIKLDLSGLTGTNYRMRVTNNRQEVSSVYYLSGGTNDSTAPVVAISTTDPSNITAVPLLVSGTASDGVGVVGCKWRLGSQPDALNGTSMVGTTSWSGNANSFSSGSNTLYVGCYDLANNWGYDSITVNYTPETLPAVTSINESFEDNSFGLRNWYDNTNHGTIATGGYSGNCLQWSWAQGEAQPTNGGSMRRLFDPADRLYVSFYVKLQTGWRGSQQTYHPHMITIPSDLDEEYAPLANNYLNTYIEFNSDLGSPYTIRPAMAIQDEKRVNTASGTPPLDLSAITENRSVAYCNTPVPDGAAGICYADNPYYSANVWKASNASVSTNSWHHVEVYLQMNTIDGGIGQSDGIMREWVDGVQVLNHTDVMYRTGQDATKKWAQFVFSPWIGDGSPIAQTMWIDELTVGTTSPYVVIEPGPEPWRVSVPKSFSGSIQ